MDVTYTQSEADITAAFTEREWLLIETILDLLEQTRSATLPRDPLTRDHAFAACMRVHQRRRNHTRIAEES
jgi:hypothetical protein